MRTNAHIQPLAFRKLPELAGACSRHRKTAAAWSRAEARRARRRLRRLGKLATRGEG